MGSGIDATSLGTGVVVGALSLEGGSVSGGVSTERDVGIEERGGGEAVGTVHRLQAGSRRRRSRFHRRMNHLISRQPDSAALVSVHGTRAVVKNALLPA